MNHVKYGQCVQCGKTYPAAPDLTTCTCGGVLEIKNLATAPAWQHRGYARALVDHVADAARGRFAILQAGTGESPLTVPFYEACGFCYSHRVKNFFTDHYDHPIWEGGVQLVDMVYYRRAL